MTGKRRGPLPPVLFLGAVILQILAYLFLPIMVLIPGGPSLLSLIPIVVGVVVVLMASRMFTTAKTTSRPFEKPSTLVTEGPFRFSRNPMYLGMLLILIGVAIALGVLAPFLVIPLFIWVISARFISAEEAQMGEAFGQAFEDYMRRVRRWL